MKKTLLFAAAVFALAACSKVSPEKEEGFIDASRIVFNIDVQNAAATKGVKTAWEDGDNVYVFFEDNTTQYVKMTFDGTSWTYTDKDGGTTFSGLTLAASGKKLSAVFMPDFVCSAAPAYETTKWTFGSVNGYFQRAESVDYTVTTTSDVTTLSATISLTAPAGISQVYIPSSEYSAPEDSNEHVLTATHISPFIFSGVVPGGAASYSTTQKGFPLTAYSGTIGSEAGYYFWGILEGAGTYDFDFQLVERNADKGYAISSQSKSVTGTTVGASFAAKLTGLTDNGNFVSLGYAGGPLWATGNLDKTNKTIVDPLEAGEYFMYGYTTPYNSSDAKYSGEENPLSTDHDAAYQTNTAWRIPTREQIEALFHSSNTSTKWYSGWTSIGTDKGGRLITSKANGISLFLAAAGRYSSGSLKLAGTNGMYWTSTPKYSNTAYYLLLSSSYIGTDTDLRVLGSSIRPVKN